MPGGGKKNQSSEEENTVEMSKMVKPVWEEDDNPLRKHSCTDLLWLLIFLTFIRRMVRKLKSLFRFNTFPENLPEYFSPFV